MTLLTDLKLTPAAVPGLPATLRNKLLYFLLRWEAWDDALACLAELPVETYVSFQDGLGRSAEAVVVVEERLAVSRASARVGRSRLAQSCSDPGRRWVHSERAGKSAYLGPLPFHSEVAIQSMAKQLLAAGLLAEEELSHGGTVVGLTADGKRALRETAVLDGLVEQ